MLTSIFRNIKLEEKPSIKFQIFQLPGYQLEVVFLITVILMKVPMSLNLLKENLLFQRVSC